jgi:hypothetical protein
LNPKLKSILTEIRGRFDSFYGPRLTNSEDDWFDYRLEHDPRFLARIEHARQSIRSGRGVKLEEVKI